MSKVLALKYRPKTFAKLIGQDAVTQTLALALDKQQLSHAYLFSGLRGSGKTSTARIFSKALLCESGPSATPCEVCEHCKMANENRHIDIIEMDGASNRGIDDIRDLIENTKYKPNMGRFKIFIIDEVHMLTPAAFNALLKTLEEPPEFVKFILATTDPLKLPATILSRTQHFRFKQISKSDITHHLSHILNLESEERMKRDEEQIHYELDALDMLARAGNGSLRDTLTLLDQAILFSKGYITAQNTASMLGLLDPQEIEAIFELILNAEKTGLVKKIKELESYECEVIIDELIAYLKDSFFNQDGRFSILLTERFFKILSEAKSLLYLNADQSFVLSLLFFKMLEATNIKTIEEMVESLENEKFRTPTMQKSVQNGNIKIQSEVKTPEPPPQNDDNNTRFAVLIAKLKDRNYELGDCFQKCITFSDYSDGILTWSSSAIDTNKEILKHGYPIIRKFVQEIFGIDTQIKMSQSEETEPPKLPSTNLEGSNTESCVSGHITSDKKELDVKEILEDPFVQKAQELFAPSEIKIYPKI